jgi:hypothetical protein
MTAVKSGSKFERMFITYVYNVYLLGMARTPHFNLL